jgi:predicted DNA-binding antitoxin AbrB/MazE fold protein
MDSMIHDIEAIYDQGVFRPVGPVVIPEGARVHLRVEEGKTADGVPAAPLDDKLAGCETPTLLERFQDVVGTVDDLPADSSTNLDHYLYGMPKQ